MEANAITRRGLEVHYEIAGEGPRLLFINGTGADLRDRPSIFDSPLAEHFTVLAFDQRGLGRTSAPPGPWTMADYADDAAALLAHVGWTSAFVAGVSFGGMVAQELTLRHPARVEKLVLACTSPGGRGGSSFPLHEIQDVTRATFELAMEVSDRRLDASWRQDHEDLVETAFQAYAGQRAARATQPDRERGARLQLEARRHHDTFDRLGSIACPCLVLAGSRDGLAPLANSERMVEALPDARLVVLEGGHGFLVEDPRGWTEIRDFLLTTT